MNATRIQAKEKRENSESPLNFTLPAVHLKMQHINNQNLTLSLGRLT